MSSSLKSVLGKTNSKENHNTINPTPRSSLGSFLAMQFWATVFIKNDPYKNQGTARFPAGQKNVDGFCVLSEEAPPIPPRNNTGNTTRVG